MTKKPCCAVTHLHKANSLKSTIVHEQQYWSWYYIGAICCRYIGINKLLLRPGYQYQ